MIDLKKTYDAIVVGSGGAGGIAAKELTEGGLHVLLLEAGPCLDPVRDFRTHRWPYEIYRKLPCEFRGAKLQVAHHSGGCEDVQAVPG